MKSTEIPDGFAGFRDDAITMFDDAQSNSLVSVIQHSLIKSFSICFLK